MSKLSQVNDGVLRTLLANFAMTRGAIAIGTVKSGFNTTAAVVHSIGGIVRSLAALTSQALVTGGDAFRVQPANTTVYYSVGVNAAGTVNVVQGRYLGEEFLAPTGMSLRGNGTVPPLPDTHAPFAVIKVVTGAATFTPGTTLFDASNVTTTFMDVTRLPVNERP
jgi:hypothetical protein